jgi:hypothetical protein
MIDIDATAADLRKDKLVDRGRLKPGGRKEILDEIDKLERARNLHAHVLVLPLSDSPADAKALWDKLGLDNKRDLLFVTNGKGWEVRGWGLTGDKIDAAMKDAPAAFKQYLGKGVTTSLTSLASLVTEPAQPPARRPQPPPPTIRPPATTTASSPSTSSSSDGGGHGLAIGLGIVGALVVGGVGFAIYRRNKRANESRGDFDTAKGNAEKAYTDLMLASEELGGDAGYQLQLKASDLKKQLDTIVADADGKADKMSDRVVLGKISQIESELAALRSTQLQKAQQ